LDITEALAEEYLRKYFGVVKYEPDGNIPPDFLCDGRVAVEVRRLNQNYDDGDGLRGLEETSIPLDKKIRNLLISLGPPTADKCWFVFYRFQRPIQRWKYLKLGLEKHLREFMQEPHSQMVRKSFGGGFEVEIFPSSIKWSSFFVPAGSSDSEAGGFVLQEIERNLDYCIAEKSRKIKKAKADYPEWWLVLIDLVGYGLDDLDRKQFREFVHVEKREFKKVVLLEPRSGGRSFEI